MIKIRTIKHKDQNYSTVGDYGRKKKDIWINVSDMKNTTYELAVAIHELIEQHLCEISHISIKKIDSFDKIYEQCREDEIPLPCGCEIQDEPGNDKHAPYHSQHIFATYLERQFMDEASWQKYDEKVNSLN